MVDPASLHVPPPPGISLGEFQERLALGGCAILLLAGLSRRSQPHAWLALAATPFIFRGVTGRWPGGKADAKQDTRVALADDRGVHVREAVRIEKPIAEVYEFWRRLERLPSFMRHLESVTDHGNGRSTWVARGPGGLLVRWEAEIINEVADQVIGWRSIEGSEIATAGSVNFDRVRGGRGTQLTVHLQYAAPAGRAGALAASLFGRAPSQTIREDLRRLKQLLEAGEIARARPEEAER